MRGDWDATGDPLVALRNGDPSVFETFVRTETPTFLGFFRRLGAGAHEAEDLAQEVFVRLVRHASRYRPQDRLEAFCFRTARNVWIDDRRARGARRHDRPGGEELLAAVPDGARDPAEPLAEREEAERALALVRELPEGQRLVFELGVLQELPYARVAELLSIPVGTVKSRMFNAVRRLRELLEHDGVGADVDASQGPATDGATSPRTPRTRAVDPTR